jgi:hypothetical protein
MHLCSQKSGSGALTRVRTEGEQLGVPDAVPSIRSPGTTLPMSTSLACAQQLALSTGHNTPETALPACLCKHNFEKAGVVLRFSSACLWRPTHAATGIGIGIEPLRMHMYTLSDRRYLTRDTIHTCSKRLHSFSGTMPCVGLTPRQSS